MPDTNEYFQKSVFPEFYKISEILNTKVFKDIPLPNVPMNSRTTRGMIKKSASNEVKFLDNKLYKYDGYIKKLIYNIQTRFECETFNICNAMGSLINFDLQFFPSSIAESSLIQPFDVKKSDDLFKIL